MRMWGKRRTGVPSGPRSRSTVSWLEKAGSEMRVQQSEPQERALGGKDSLFRWGQIHREWESSGPHNSQISHILFHFSTCFFLFSKKKKKKLTALGLVTWQGMELLFPAVELQSEPLAHQGSSPQCVSFWGAFPPRGRVWVDSAYPQDHPDCSAKAPKVGLMRKDTDTAFLGPTMIAT